MRVLLVLFRFVFCLNIIFLVSFFLGMMKIIPISINEGILVISGLTSSSINALLLLISLIRLLLKQSNKIIPGWLWMFNLNVLIFQVITWLYFMLTFKIDFKINEMNSGILSPGC